MLNRFLLLAVIFAGFAVLSFGQSPNSQSSELMSIEEARQQSLGTVVTVTGWVTVTSEFGGPVYFQDETGGLAWFNDNLMRSSGFQLDVARGDSIVITGELGEFGQQSGTPGTGLLQIVGNNVQYDFFPGGNQNIEPVEITATELNSNEYQGQLVRLNNIQFGDAGDNFQGNSNYSFQAPTGSGIVRIDQRTDIAGAEIPFGETDVTGVAGQFQSTAQLLPRDRVDLEADPIPGDDVPMDQTFDVVTWNIEWFGDTERGPSDLDLQMNNVLTVIRTIDADLYALQEIASLQKFEALVDSLEDFSGFWANYSQTQNTAYLFRTAVIDSINSGTLSSGQNSFDWAGRFPLFFTFDVTVNDITRRVYSYNIHAKAFGDQESYERRVNASSQLKSFLDQFRADDNVIFLGDYNDMLTESSYAGATSPYDNFVQDDNYFTITKSLEEAGQFSFLVGQFRSMIDHITVSNDLIEDHIEGAQRVENVQSYVNNFTSTTSDHAPVWTRFDFSRSLVSVVDEIIDRPSSFKLEQNYPNPFNPTTNLRFTLPESSNVSVDVFDVMGRRVATITENQQFSSGSHTVAFNASGLSSGMYIYRVTLAGGESLSGKMMIVK